MQAFSFHDLSERGREAAIFRYADREVCEALEFGWGYSPLALSKKLEGWLFTEHGERIA